MATAQPAPSITVHGNVEGSVVVGDHNFVVNTNHGTIVYQQAAPRIQPRAMTPRPPRRPRGFVGRERELAQLESWIAGGEPVYLHGQPGAGKTTLAKQAANGPAATSQPDGVVFIEGLTETTASMKMGDLVQRLFDALFESEPHLKVDLDSARSYLSNRQPLVFISSIALAPANLSALADLFPNAPILVETEQWIASDVFTHLALAPLDDNAALKLLSERSGLPLDAGNGSVLAEITGLLDEIPAALVTVGNAIRERRIGLDEALTRLRELRQDKGLDPLDSAYALVLDGLSDPEREMLIQAGAAPGISVDGEWLEKVGGKPVSQSLESLGLLQANSPRLRLSPGLRGLIQSDHGITAAREKLLRHLISELENRWNDFDFVAAELGNLLGLLDWAATRNRWQDIFALARGLDPFLTLRGLWTAWGAALDTVYFAATAAGDEAMESWALHQLGVYQIGKKDFTAARILLTRAHDLRLVINDETGAAYTRHNLDFLEALSAPAKTKSGRKKPRLMTGLLITLTVIGLLAAGTVFGANLPFATRTPTPTATQTASATPAPSATATPSPLPSPTSSSTPTPSPTAAPTRTATWTPTPTPTPTFIPLIRGVFAEYAYCFYGPGRMYLSFTGIYAGAPIEVIGRNDAGDWVYVQFPSAQDPKKLSNCWFEAKSIKLDGEVLRLEPVYPDKAPPPISQNPVGYPGLKNVVATRQGSAVTITWDENIIPDGDRFCKECALYLVEAWVCRAGEIVFVPMGVWGKPIATLTDEPGCSEPSHGRVFLSEKHGYIGPVEIEWPQP
ncbi:MAG: hypothetical protein AB1846_15160 [Chloroflexota bacterium]